MKNHLLFIFAIMTLQACKQDLPDTNIAQTVSTTQEDAPKPSWQPKDCLRNAGTYCEIPVELAYSQDFLGKMVKLRGVIVAVDDSFWRKEKPMRFEMYASGSAAEVCGNGIGIIPKNDEQYQFMLTNDGYVMDVSGELSGSQLPYYRVVELERVPEFGRDMIHAAVNINCGKIPPLPPPPPPRVQSKK